MDFKALLRKSEYKPALIIGNGVNLFNAGKGVSDWEQLLLQLWQNRIGDIDKKALEGISLTEFYDALDLKLSYQSKTLKAEFCEGMADWQSKDQHRNIVKWASVNQCPILTTNFENTLSDSLGLKLHRLTAPKPTDYYPWSNYYAAKPITDTANEFAIWHINGMQHYKRSIRLGLSDYMGSVERVRPMLHKSGNRLFYRADFSKWPGRHTWLNPIFQNDLFIFGLSLEVTEVFLRWLLIERAKFFKKFPNQRREAFFIHDKPLAAGQQLFLESVGIKPILVNSYDDIYVAPW
ncbi:MAG: hypothetical protein J0M22_18020 [Gammaproteobacteria bacterium]|nr:hypothetical protein [Gammaproteobacteria bacterium]